MAGSGASGTGGVGGGTGGGSHGGGTGRGTGNAGGGGVGGSAGTPGAGNPGGGSLAGAFAKMFSGTLVSRILGMVRSLVLLAALGAGLGSGGDPFNVANNLPNTIYNLLAGGVMNAILVPQIVRAMRSRDGGSEYLNKLITLAGTILFLATVVFTVAAPLLVMLYAGGMDPAWRAVAIAMALWCIPELFFYGLYALFGNVLNARGSFGPYMWAPVLNNVVSITGLFVYIWVFGTFASGSGTDPGQWDAARIALVCGVSLLGVASQALVLIPALRRSGVKFKPDFKFRGAGLSGASRMAKWAFVGLLIGQVGFLMLSNVANAANGAAREIAASGGTLEVAIPTITAYTSAFMVYMLPQSLVTTSLVTAVFTSMSNKAAAGNHTGVRDDMSRTVRTLGVFTMFASAAMVVLALPVVQTVLFTTPDGAVPGFAAVLAALAVGIPGQSIWTVVQRVSFAYEDARTLAKVQIPMSAIIVVFGAVSLFFLPPQWWVVVTALGASLSQYVGSLIGYLSLRTKLPSLDGSRILRTYLRLTLAALPTALAGWVLLHFWGPQAGGFFGAFLRLAVLGTLMLAIYVGLLRVLGVSELDDLTGPLLRILKRLRGGGAGAGGAGTAGAAAGAAAGADGATAAGAAATSPGTSSPDGVPSSPATSPTASPASPAGTPAPGSPAAESPAPHAADAPPSFLPVSPITLPPAAPPPPPPPNMGDTGNIPIPMEYLTDDRKDMGVHDSGTGASLMGRFRLLRRTETFETGAEVWEGRDSVLDRPVTVVAASRSGEGAVGAAILDSARRASLVEDTRFARLVDIGQTPAADSGTWAYVVSVDPSGTPLDAVRTPLDAAIARAVVGETAAALEAARRRGVQHGALHSSAITIADGAVSVTGLAYLAVAAGTHLDSDDPVEASLKRSRADAEALEELYRELTGQAPPQEIVGAPNAGAIMRALAPWGKIELPQEPQQTRRSRGRGGAAAAVSADAPHSAGSGGPQSGGTHAAGSASAHSAGSASEPGGPSPWGPDSGTGVGAAGAGLAGAGAAGAGAVGAGVAGAGSGALGAAGAAGAGALGAAGAGALGAAGTASADAAETASAGAEGPTSDPSAPPPPPKRVLDPSTWTLHHDDLETDEAPEDFDALLATEPAEAHELSAGTHAATVLPSWRVLVPGADGIAPKPEREPAPEGEYPDDGTGAEYPGASSENPGGGPAGYPGAVDTGSYPEGYAPEGYPGAPGPQGPELRDELTDSGITAGAAIVPPSPRLAAGSAAAAEMAEAAGAAGAGAFGAAGTAGAAGAGIAGAAAAGALGAAGADAAGMVGAVDDFPSGGYPAYPGPEDLNPETATYSPDATMPGAYPPYPADPAGGAAGAGVVPPSPGDPSQTAGVSAGARVVPPSSGTGFGARVTQRIDDFAQRHDVRVPGEIRDPENLAQPLSQRRLDPGPFVLVFIALILAIAMIFSFRTLANVEMPVTRAAGGPIITGVEKPPPPPPIVEEPEEEPQEEAPAVTATPTIANIGVLDPPPDGDGQENPDLTYRAWDGDPNTWWRSRSYVSPTYGMKSGIGLDIQLTEPALVHEVVIHLNGEGGHVQVLGDPGVVLSEDRLVLGEADMGRETVITFPEPVEMTNVVLWFTSLPVADSDGKNRVEMTEVEVR